MEIDTTPVKDFEVERNQAIEHWRRSSSQPMQYKGEPSLFARSTAQCVQILNAKKIFEFGCNAGRNLNAIQEFADPRLEVSGLDICEEAIAFGREHWRLNISVGNEHSLKNLEDNSFDFVFTCSVIDHLPSPQACLLDLLRITRKYLLLIEPVANQTGAVQRIQESVAGRREWVESTPYTYIHNYAELITRAGADCVLDFPFPTHVRKLGPYYRFRLCTKEPDAEKQRILQSLGLDSRSGDVYFAVDEPQGGKWLVCDSATIRSLEESKTILSMDAFRSAIADDQELDAAAVLRLVNKNRATESAYSTVKDEIWKSTLLRHHQQVHELRSLENRYSRMREGYRERRLIIHRLEKQIEKLKSGQEK